VLIHPEVVLTAAHCGTDQNEVRFGEDWHDPQRTVSIEQCVQHPEFDSDYRATDYMVCMLERSVPDVPRVPILMGCETQVLEQHERPVISVGFGRTPDVDDERKRAVELHIDTRFQYGEHQIALHSSEDRSLCRGDSGGPSFVELDDGTWRLFGLHKSGSCGLTGGTDVRIHPVVEWIETETGFDVTPCHTADGSYDPGDECGPFPTDPGSGHGSWPACGTGPTAAGMRCGGSFDAGVPSPDAGADAGHADAGHADAGIADGGAPGDASITDAAAGDGSIADAQARRDAPAPVDGSSAKSDGSGLRTDAGEAGSVMRASGSCAAAGGKTAAGLTWPWLLVWVLGRRRRAKIHRSFPRHGPSHGLRWSSAPLRRGGARDDEVHSNHQPTVARPPRSPELVG
jgi:uncharacterized protein (TIGR03382 family)